MLDPHIGTQRRVCVVVVVQGGGGGGRCTNTLANYPGDAAGLEGIALWLPVFKQQPPSCV